MVCTKFSKYLVECESLIFLKVVVSSWFSKHSVLFLSVVSSISTFIMQK